MIALLSFFMFLSGNEIKVLETLFHDINTLPFIWNVLRLSPSKSTEHVSLEKQLEYILAHVNVFARMV